MTGFWTDVAVEQLLRWVEKGARPHEIARKMGRPENAIRTKLNLLRAEGKIAEESKQARGDLSGRTIVDQAKYWLQYAGYTERELAVMSLDDIMFQANTRLHRWNMPQLGAKPEWRVSK